MVPRKFVDLDEAAKMLGVTADTLNEMRERQKIYGYRDGGSWKFKIEDVERVISDRDSADEGEYAELDEDPDSILLSEVELGGSDESTSSTIIGGRSSKKDSADSDIQLAPPSGIDEPLKVEKPKHDSAVDLDAPLTASGKGGSDLLAAGSGVSPMFDELDTLDLDMPSAADSGIHGMPTSKGDSALDLGLDAGGSAITMGSDALSLDGSNLTLGEASGLELESDADGGSAIDLAGDEDGDLVLGGSSHGDLSRSGDSGISLLDPADSGISLESQPLELGGSAVESLELGEDDMLVADDPAASVAASGADIGESDDDFLLTPLEEGGAEESDSGSQVIPLEDDLQFEEMAPGASAVTGGVSGLQSGPQSSLGGLLEEDLGGGFGSAAALSESALTPASMPAAASAPAAMSGGVAMAPDVPFSGWVVTLLALCAVMLMLVGTFTFDLLRNMWSWDKPYDVNSTLMTAVLSWFEK